MNNLFQIPLSNTYLTVYRKDYVKKAITKASFKKGEQEFQDPVAEGFRHYLQVDDENIKPPNENGEEYLEKFKKLYEPLGKRYFKEPLAKDVIFLNHRTDGVTEYQTKYCDMLKDAEYNKTSHTQKFELPEDYSIPLTTYKSKFRIPASVCPDAYDKPTVFRPKSSLGTNEKLNEILKVKTGRTEYMETIGHLGEFIVVNNMHGPLRKCDIQKFPKN